MTGRVVIVTGGSRGVGRGITERFLEAGADVVICARKPPEALPSAGDSGREAHFVEADVREVEQIERVVAFTTERFQHLDVLVNNAGGSPAAEAATASPRFSEAILRLNLIAPLHLSQMANAIMQTQAEGGSIISIASISEWLSQYSHRGMPTMVTSRPACSSRWRTTQEIRSAE